MLEKAMTSHSSTLLPGKPMDRGAWQASVHGVAKSQTQLSNFTFTFHFPTLEKEMATHSSVLAWRIPGTGEPGGLPSMGVAQSQTRLKWLSSSSPITAIYLLYNSAVLLLDIYPREIKPYVYTKTCTWVFLAALFTMVWNWNQPKCPSTDEWINRLWYIHTIAKQLSNKKEWIIDS